MKKLISIVVPCFNEEESIPFFYKEIDRVSKELKKTEFEFLFIDDGSKDKTLDTIIELSKKDKRIKYISFSRNFGKEAAMYAGFENSKGDYVATMDADLQDPPNLLIEMYRILEEEDYDCVGTKRTKRRGEPKIRSFFARRFYKIINKMSDIKIVDGARDFRLMKRQMVDAIVSMKEDCRFSKGIYEWVGFKTKWLEFDNVQRVAGKTKWSFYKLFLYSIEGIVSFSNSLLSVPIVLGTILFIGSIIYLIIRSFMTKIIGIPIIIFTILISTSLILISLGIISMYVLRMNKEIKNRPIYISRKTNIKK